VVLDHGLFVHRGGEGRADLAARGLAGRALEDLATVICIAEGSSTVRASRSTAQVRPSAPDTAVTLIFPSGEVSTVVLAFSAGYATLQRRSSARAEEVKNFMII
jgi:hypothetical protein